VIDFRAMVEADVDRVYANECAAYAFPWTRGNLEDCVREGKLCRVLQVDGMIAGHGVLAIAAGEGHLLNVCVAPEYQGLGLGRRLVEHLLELAVQGGADVVFLEVRWSNAPAIALYESVGFNAIGTRPNYYQAPSGHEDAQVMALDLSSGFAGGTV
jgi:ribosomal-protein-alanine N-acetyltransferase